MAGVAHIHIGPSSASLRGHSSGGGARPRRTSRIQAKIREIFMPALSSTMTEGKIVSWVKAEGEKLSKGESVVVVESDKADMDVETFYDGYLAAIMVEEGAVAAVGSAIALLAETEDEIDLAKSQVSSSSSSPSASHAATAPAANTPAPPSPLEIASEAVSSPLPSPTFSPAAVSSTHPASESGRRIVAKPFSKKLAKDLKVELGSVVGSWPMRRIVVKDVEAAAVAAAAAPVSSDPLKSISDSAAVKAPSSSAIQLGTVVPFTTDPGRRS